MKNFTKRQLKRFEKEQNGVLRNKWMKIVKHNAFYIVSDDYIVIAQGVFGNVMTLREKINYYIKTRKILES